MKKLPVVFLFAAALAGLSRPVAAQTATQTVTFEVQAINQLSVSGNPGALTISTATAGNAPTSATSASTTWAITTNESNKKVTAAINSAMPAGVTLTLTLTAPGGASNSAVTLGTVAQDAVTGISKLNASGLTVTYGLDATTAAGTVASTTRTVTLTIM